MQDIIANESGCCDCNAENALSKGDCEDRGLRVSLVYDVIYCLIGVDEL